MQLRDGEQAVVICDGANDCDGLVGIGFFRALGGDFAGNAGDGHGRAINAGHEESFEDDFVEVGVSSAWKVWTLVDFRSPRSRTQTYGRGSGTASPTV